jgi:hypothetical protein
MCSVIFIPLLYSRTDGYANGGAAIASANHEFHYCWRLHSQAFGMSESQCGANAEPIWLPAILARSVTIA